MPARDLALLSEAAREAGVIARRYFGGARTPTEKPGGQGPVTEADLAVDRFLRARLCTARPGYGWLSEESPDTPERLAARRVFVVDPIDGTRSFVEGDKIWAHALAVVEDGAAVAGAVYLPMLDRLYTAHAGGGARCDGVPIAASARDALSGAKVLATRAQMEARYWPGGVPDLLRRFRPSLAYRLCLVAAGRFDAMFSFRDVWEWDSAAGDLIAREAGARVTDSAGAPLVYNSAGRQNGGIIAAGPALHEAIRARAHPAAAPAVSHLGKPPAR